MTRHYKKSNDKPIYIKGLWKAIVKRWTLLIICALIGGVFVGSYPYLKNLQYFENADNDIVLSEEELEEVNLAKDLEKMIADRKIYWNESTLMKIDPYYKPQVVMQFYIEASDPSYINSLINCYFDYLATGMVATDISNSINIFDNEEYISELINAGGYFETETSNYADLLGGNIVSVSVTGTDIDMAEQLADEIENAMMQYRVFLTEHIGGHSLNVICRKMGFISDPSLASNQLQVISGINNLQGQYNTLTAGFIDEQKEMLENHDLVQPTESSRKGAFIVLYIALGVCLGGFLGICFVAGIYLLSNCVKSVEELTQLYSFPIFGKFLGKKEGNDFELEQALLLSKLRLYCQKKKPQKVFLDVSFAMDELEQSCIEKVLALMKELKVEIVQGENIFSELNDWKQLSQIDAVLFAMKVGTSNYAQLDKELDIYHEYGIDVLGAFVFETA